MDILHCDLNNFYASVEQAVDPSLRCKYLAVSGSCETRSGIILAKNMAAKAMGVRTGDAIWQAKQKCPELVCVPPHFEYYAHYSQRVRQIYERYTDRVEGFGLDECWLDVTHSGMFGSPWQIAEQIRRTVQRETGLTISVGVSFTKTFAKLGSDMKKPNATTVISRDNYREVVWKLPVGDMIYIGSHTARKLNGMGIFTLGDLANANPDALRAHFGVVGDKLRRAARGEDDEQVQRCGAIRDIKSVGHSTTMLHDVYTYAEADKVLLLLSDMVATRLRRYGLQCATVGIYVRSNDLSCELRQCAVRNTQVADDIYHAAARLLRSAWLEGTDLPLRSLGVHTSRLSDVGGGCQLSIFDGGNDKNCRLGYCIDLIRNKFGYGAIMRASLLGKGLTSDKLIGEEDLLPFKR